MDKRMMPYYLSRAAIAIAFGALFYASGSPIWLAAAVSIALVGLFLWAPHSGRYAVHPEYGATALRRDERTQAINDQAARNAFVISMLVIGAISVYYSATGAELIPAGVLRIILLTGTAGYFISDLWLRQTE
jgi:hypothetical protein